MRPEIRRSYAAAYDPSRTRRYLDRLSERAGTVPGFRVAETPVFFDARFFERARAAGEAILAQLNRPETRAELEAAVPARFAMPGRQAMPDVAVVDFAATRAADGSLEPRLVELQGFPSLLAFESLQGDAWIEALAEIPGCEGPWEYADGGRAGLLDLARATVLGDEDPGEVVLLDVDPPRQKTLCDFTATERLFGVRAVDPSALEVRGGRIYRRDASGRGARVRRIYNRIILDDLERAGRSLPWDLREELDVRWVTHPDWYFMWSKFALPYLRHDAVPATHLLADVDPRDLDLSRYVLKPLFSFAGGGVVLRPTLDRILAIPQASRRDFCLQERIVYDDVLASPEGGVKLEVRLMYLRPDGEPSLRYATNLCRLSRGEMIGVDYNKDLPWTGSSIGLAPAGTAARAVPGARAGEKVARSG